MRSRLPTLLLATTLAAQVPPSLLGQEPPPLRRRVALGARIAEPQDSTGALVRSVERGSAAERAGLRAGDRVVRLNGRAVADPIGYGRLLRAIRSGDTTRFRVVRTQASAGSPDTLDLAIAFPPLPEERIPGVSVTYGSIVSERGHRLRTIVTKPAGAAARVPAILFVAWLSCVSIEYRAPGDGWDQVLRALAARSGMLLFRVERPGLGDSDGPDCSDAVLEDDLAGYIAAMRALRARPDVDTTRIFVLGASMGGALAPIVAQALPAAAPARGIIVPGGFAKTWYEHMLEFERRRLALAGRSPREVSAAMPRYAELYTEYLIRRRIPGDVIRDRPDLRALWEEPPAHQYGRPAAYYHQVQALNVAGAWERISSPVLILHGEYDYIMSRDDQHLVLDIVNARRPGSAKLVLLPKTDHDLSVYRDLQAAFDGQERGYDPQVERQILAWLRAHAR